MKHVIACAIVLAALTGCAAAPPAATEPFTPSQPSATTSPMARSLGGDVAPKPRASADIGVRAQPVDNFLNSLGACVHVQHHMPAAKLAPDLQYMGLRNVRDGADGNYDMSGLILLHQRAGVMVVFGPGSGAKEDSLAKSIAGARQLAAAGALLAVEGPNEPNNFGGVTYHGKNSDQTKSWMPVAEYQKDLYAAVKSDPELKKYPVFGPSEVGAEDDNAGLQFLTVPADAHTLSPAGTVFADFANVHNYVCGHIKGLIDNQPTKAADYHNVPGIDGLFGNHGITWRKHFMGYPLSQLKTLPRVTTETGFKTNDTPAGDERQGKVFINTYLAQFKGGWKYTFFYELADDSDGAFGFYKADLVTPRAAAMYMHNLTTILADSYVDSSDHAEFSGDKLNYSIPNEPNTVHDLLLQKHNGTFDLIVWGEQVTGSNAVTVNLGGPHASVQVFDPTVGAGPTQTLTNAASVPLTVSDHAVIIEVKN